MKIVTLTWLREKGACNDQVESFEQTFGESAPLTKRNLVKAARAGLDLSWFARRYLSPTAWKAYQEATAAALKAYHEEDAAALKAYNEADAAAWKACREATAAALWEAIKMEQVK